jgi:serine protease Do
MTIAAILAATAGSAEARQASQENHRAVFVKAVDSVVGIRAMAPLGERSGTGVVVSKDGYIVTSYATVPEGSEQIRVYLHGPRLLIGKLVGTSRAHELSLIKVEPKSELVPIEFGDSAGVKPGDVSYTLGNAAHCIIDNDAASLGVGIISGAYTLRVARANSTYTGPVLETTAAVNIGMEGSPLLDGKGRMVGFVTLNYSPSRFLGNAIPVNPLKPVLERLRGPDGGTPTTVPESQEPGYLGVTVGDKQGRVSVESVEAGSPAARAGISKGTILTALGGTSLKDAAEFRSRLKELKEGDLIFIKVEDDGLAAELKITLGKKGR